VSTGGRLQLTSLFSFHCSTFGLSRNSYDTKRKYALIVREADVRDSLTKLVFIDNQLQENISLGGDHAATL
jgi:hypothetical protein